MKQLNVKILENKKVAQGFYKMSVESSYLAKNSEPGQFIEVRCSNDIEPLLRRPLGVHRILKNGIEMLYEVVGKGTAMLSEKKAGTEIDLIGPLGNGFDVAASTKAAILIAGGNGVAPLLALAKELKRKGSKIKVLIGACSKTHILCEKECKELGAKVLVATEDGSKGLKGLATDLLKKSLGDKIVKSSNDIMIYACGPTGMLKEIAKITHEHRIPCQVSLEERMACGVGVCLGCPVKVKKSGYKMVCKDGPVFNAEDIAW